MTGGENGDVLFLMLFEHRGAALESGDGGNDQGNLAVLRCVA